MCFVVTQEECVTSDKLDLGHSRSLEARNICSFRANHHFSHSLNKFRSFFSVINDSRPVTAVLNRISVCASNMLHVKFLNFSRYSEFVNIESCILRFTLSLKRNSHEIHLSINSEPKTFLMAF